MRCDGGVEQEAEAREGEGGARGVRMDGGARRGGESPLAEFRSASECSPPRGRLLRFPSSHSDRLPPLAGIASWFDIYILREPQ